MALVASRALIEIALTPLVFLVHAGLVVFVTVDATEHGVSGRSPVTVVAGCPLAGVLARVDGELVGHRRALPLRRGVTCRAGGWEPGGDVVRVRHRLERSAVATVAVGRSSSITSANVATRTGDRRVSARQWKLRLAVIEYSSAPLRRAVADGAVSREAGRHMVWIRGGVVVSQVAAFTSGGRPLIDAVLMALRALYRRMSTG